VSTPPPATLESPESPINWLILNAEEARAEFLALDHWVNFLRAAYGLPPAIIPPLWHRHDELIWELSALHLHWLNSYHPTASLSAPNHWHQDFAAARARLREWVSTNGTRLDRDRPTRITTWPGEPQMPTTGEIEIVDRDADFRRFLDEDSRQRQRDAS